MTTTFKWLHAYNQWGLRGHNLVEGTKVSVVKKSGKVEEKIVGKIVYTDPEGFNFALMGNENENKVLTPSDLNGIPAPSNNSSDIDLDTLSVEERELENQLAEIRRQKAEKLRLAKEIELAEAKKKELEKFVTINVKEYYIAGNLPAKLQVAWDVERSDVIGVVKPAYAWVKEINVLVADWPDMEKKLRALENVAILWSDEAREKYEWHQSAPAWEIVIEPGTGNILCKAGPKESNRWQISSKIPGIYWNQAKREYQVHAMESWRIPEAFEHTEDIFYSDDARELIFSQLEKRAKLDSIAKKEDSTILKDNHIDLHIEPRPFQNVGVEFVDAANGCALIADDTGLGKTLQSIGFAELRRANNLTAKKFQTLCIVKAGNIANWVREIKRFTGIDPLVVKSGKPSGEEMYRITMKREEYVIISYDTIGSKFYTEQDRLIKQWGSREKAKNDPEWDKGFYPWTQLFQMSMPDLLIMDEAHQIKNSSTHRFKAIKPLNFITHRIPMTASPVLNRTSELWTLLHMVAPHIFDSEEKFLNLYTEDGKRTKDVEKLHEMMRPIMIRRRKKDVQKDLPPINRIHRYHEISDRALRIYDKILEGIYETISTFDPLNQGGEEKEIFHILSKILRLKQVCADDKVEYTCDLATELADEGKRVLIFTQFKGTCAKIAQLLGQEAVCTVKRNVNGPTFDSMNATERDRLFESVRNNPEIKFIVTTTAAQEGHNLEFMDDVIFNDLFWTPEAHRQCEGRSYGRLSNPHPIDSYWIVADVGERDMKIEQWILELLNAKMMLIEETVDGVEASRDISESIGKELIQRIKDQMFRQGRRVRR